MSQTPHIPFRRMSSGSEPNRDVLAAPTRSRGPTWSGRAIGFGQRAVMVQWLFVLPLGAHMQTVDPTVALPIPSSAVPVPRLIT